MSLESLFSPEQIQNLAMALLHSLWQAALIAAGLLLLLRLVPARRSDLRYGMCLAALALILTSGFATWGWLEIRSPDFLGFPEESHVATDKFHTAMVVTWLLGVSGMLIRLLLSLYQTRQYKSNASPASDRVIEWTSVLAKQAGLCKPLHVLITDHLTSPAVLGMLQPVLLLPAAMMTSLTEVQIKAILAHEIAHIRRWDGVVNFCQMLIEALLFYNPAVWWVGRQTRLEREACCDMAGVKVCGDAGGYSEALATFAHFMKASQSRKDQLPTSLLAFADHRGSSLLDRVQRILFPGQVPKARFSAMGTLLLFAMGIGLLAIIWKGTLIAVAIADELIPHERVVSELTQQRDENIGRPTPIKEQVKNTGEMELRIKISTHDGKPTTCRVIVDSITFSETNGGSSANSTCGTVASIPAGQSTVSSKEDVSWIHLLFTGADYAPVAVKMVKPDASGIADVAVTLQTGIKGELRITDDNGAPIPNAQVSLHHNLVVKRERQLSASSRTSGSYVTGRSGAKLMSSDKDGLVSIQHGTQEPLLRATISASGFESHQTAVFGIEAGETKTVTLRRALPVRGQVVDSKGEPIGGAKIHRISSYRETPGSIQSYGGGKMLTRKEFGEALATTDSAGEFELNQLSYDQTYLLLVDAGEKGLAIAKGIRPGEKDVKFVVKGPIQIKGVVTGDLDRIRKNDKYRLKYGVSVKDTQGSSNGDSTGVVEVTVKEGEGRFELRNVTPGAYTFRYDDWKYCLRGVQIDQSVDRLEMAIPDRSTDEANAANLTTPRKVRLAFKSSDGTADFRGRISIRSRSKNRTLSFYRVLDVEYGEVDFSVNAPTDVQVEVMDAPGFGFADGLQRFKFKVLSHSENSAVGKKIDEPMHEQTLKVLPAGAVSGILRSAIQSDEWMGVSGEVSWRTAKAYRSRTLSDECDESGHFYLPGIPYGATVSLVARHGSWSKQLDPILIDAATPQVQVNVKMGTGPVLSGVVVNADGKKLSRVPVMLKSYSSKYQSNALKSVFTDAEGAFEIGQINAEEGEYFLETKFDRQYTQSRIPLDDFSQPIEIRVESGKVIEGQLIDDTTGDPIADAEVYAHLKEFSLRKIYAFEAEAKTDSNGRFRFSNLTDDEFYLNTRVIRARQVDRQVITPDKRDVVLRVKIGP